MKIGVISDIHSNIIALDAVLDFLIKQGCNSFICCGDIIGIGPYPEQTVSRIRELPNLTIVIGNHEAYLKNALNAGTFSGKGISIEEQNQKKWECEKLSASSIKFICDLPIRSDMIIKGKKITVMHYALNENNDFINIIKDPSGDDLSRMFNDEKADILIFGHDHKQTIQKFKSKFFINFGSVGCPSILKNVARAGILNFIDEEITVTPVDITYDVEKVFDDMERFDFPSYELIKKFFFGI
ncbi:hypothetical protein M9Y10_038415 [Tritrichomonas musculus]|uniref:Calcineurin-like phosphoesterase domain-containing protein n=1 Tax=Tritrichomonas musculus TaxID=1915356 RepID=A0ABR2KBI8_9EUKA